MTTATLPAWSPSTDAKVYPHVAKAEQYMADVLAGRLNVSRLTRLCIERQVKDLARQGEEGFPYVFDLDLAEDACDFAEALKHTKGEWKGQAYRLEPWQCFRRCVLFGWAREGRLRRFRKASFYVARKNGKSQEAAVDGLYLFTEEEGAPEIFSGATTEKQAWEVFRPARLMAKAVPELCEAFGISVNAKSLTLEDGGRFVPVIGDPGDGPSPHGAIVDEYHEHSSSRLLDTMETGMGARRQPLLMITSTAGFATEGPCFDDWRTCQKILEGSIEDETHFVLLYAADPDEPWDSDLAMEQANPNLGVSVKLEYLQALREAARNNPRKQGAYKTKHLNQWVTARASFYNVHTWGLRVREGMTLADLTGRNVVCGVDLASKIDVAAVLWIGLPRSGGEPTVEDPVLVVPWLYLPEDRLDDPEAKHYVPWAETGELITTDGSATDLGRIRDDILGARSLVQLGALGYDPHEATLFSQELEAEGVPCIEIGQTQNMLSEPMKESDAWIREGKLIHDGNRCMGWMIGNVVTKENYREQVYPRKEREEAKIDGPTAMITALRARHFVKGPSVYETRGVVAL